MFKIMIDYEGTKPIVDHWYGNRDDTALPSLGDSGERFYNLIALDLTRVPILVTNPLSRIYLPHLLTSTITVEDLYFKFERGHVTLINDLRGARIELFEDYIDHRPRSVTFERLKETENPASDVFDEEALTFPHHQLGGLPYFKQPGGHELCCSDCGQLMDFLLQFDCDDRLGADFEDDGSVYYWWCGSCRIVGCRVESA